MFHLQLGPTLTTSACLGVKHIHSALPTFPAMPYEAQQGTYLEGAFSSDVLVDCFSSVEVVDVLETSSEMRAGSARLY
jgi:hypothetical protein